MMVSRTTDQEALLERIRSHLSQLDAKFRFANRLAKENQWPLGFTYEVINEYAKFLFLAKEGGHLVTPPPIIDKAWHLHLLYTEAYWGELCPKVLGMNLHHVPAAGSKKEALLLQEGSTQTILSYRKFFGEPHPLWLVPKDKINRSLLKNVGFVLAGITAGILLCSAITGVVLYAVCALLFAVPSAILFTAAASQTAVKHPFPKVNATTKGAHGCGGGNICSGQGGWSGGADAGGHGGHGCGGH